MAKRAENVWEKKSKSAKDSDDSVKALYESFGAEHPTYCRDFKKFYTDLLAPDVKDPRNGKTHAEMWGKIHDFMVDFLHFEELEGPPQDQACRHVEPYMKRLSTLHKYLPERTKAGFKERWIYFRTLDGEPEIQDGADGAISRMYHGPKIWQGLLIRIKGDAMLKGILIPRGHLKSTIGTEAYTLWRIIRDLTTRVLIRCIDGPLAQSFVGTVKSNFEFNERFRERYARLGPPAKHGTDKGCWNENAMQVRTKFGFRSAGKEPTLMAKGMESDVTGKHFNRIVLDDVVGEENSNTPGLRAKGIQRVRNMFAVRDPGTSIIDIGTVWEDTDSHSIFTDTRRSEVAKRGSSFFIATVLDGDESVKVSGNLSQLGHGKPIWPEKWTMADLEDLRAGMDTDHQWYGQMFNQIKGASMRVFKREWIRTYSERPEDVAREKKLHIFMHVDPTQGKKDQTGRVDYTAAFVLGQTRDRKQFYWLGGFCQKLSAAQVPDAILDLAAHWKGIAYQTGSHFNCSIEESSFTNYLHTSLSLAMRMRGDAAYFEAKPFKTNNVQKYDHIRKLALPYSHGKFLWPEFLFVTPVVEKGEAGEIYDLREVLQEQFEKYPGVAFDDLIDAHAGAFAMTYAEDYRDGEAPEVSPADDRSVYTRAQALESPFSQLAGFDNEDAHWGERGADLWN